MSNQLRMIIELFNLGREYGYETSIDNKYITIGPFKYDYAFGFSLEEGVYRAFPYLLGLLIRDKISKDIMNGVIKF